MFPFLAPGPQSDNVISLQFTVYPKKLWSRAALKRLLIESAIPAIGIIPRPLDAEKRWVVRKGGFDIPSRPKSKEINAKLKNPHQHWLLAPFH